MKTIMIIGAGKTQVPLIKAAKKEGYHTIVCDWDTNAPGIPLADEFFNVSTKDRRGLLRTARENKVDGVVANSEYAMEDVAYISSALGLTGNSIETIATLSSKNRFRALQEKSGLFTPKFVCDDPNGVKKLSHPIIIKPDMNSGTRGTAVVYKIDDSTFEAVTECRKLSRNGRAIIEEFMPVSPQTGIEGEIFIYNGVILWDGLFTAIRSDKAPMIPMTYVFPMREQKEGELRKVLERVFKAAGVVHGEYNVEAFFLKDELFIVEINPRQGGNDLPQYVQRHCGVDYYRLLVTTSVGDVEYMESLKGFKRENNLITHHMLYPRQSGVFSGLQIDEEIRDYVENTVLYVNAGDMIEKANDGAASIGFVDLVFKDEQEQMKVSYRLENLIRILVDEN